MEDMTTLSVVKLFPETKKQQDSFVERLVGQVLGGNADPLEVEVLMCRMEQVIKKYRNDKRVQEAVLNEAEKYGQKTFGFRNAKVTIKETGVKYDYSASCDWQQAKAEADKAADTLKAIEDDLKKAREIHPYLDRISGELITCIPKSSTTRAVIEINKR